MIVVKYRDNGHKRKLTVTGHAGYGPYGEDIFCAAASTLIMTLEKALENRGILYNETIRDGYAEIRCRDKKSKGTFYTCLCGYLQLAELYPDYYSVEC